MLVFFCFLTFLLILRYPMKCDLLFFLLHNLSQAELGVKRKVICTKEDTSLQLHEKKIPFEWSWRQDVKVTHAQRLQKKSLSLE